MAIYLWALTAIYTLFAFWTAFAPDATAKSLGIAFPEAAGRIEYVTVYGGIEAGLAIVFALAALQRMDAPTIVTVSAIVHTALAAFRVLGILKDGGPNVMTWGALTIEVTAAAAGWWLCMRAGQAALGS